MTIFVAQVGILNSWQAVLGVYEKESKAWAEIRDFWKNRKEILREKTFLWFEDKRFGKVTPHKLVE